MIYIHTLGRSNNQPTLLFLQTAGFQPHLVVQAHEAVEYRVIYKNTPLVVLPESIRTLSPTRQWLLENCPERFMFLMDDDLRFSYKDPEDRTKLLNARPENIRNMMGAMVSKLQRYAHVGISAREGNNRKPESYYKNERMMRVLAYDRDRIPEDCRFDRVPAKQDFDMTLQLLRRGLANCVIYEYAQDQVAGSNSRGGCSVYRTEEMADEAARELKRLHPKFVRLVEKDNSNWKGFKNEKRLEVVISWKQAFDSGRVK
jgi:hypothetical protein